WRRNKVKILYVAIESEVTNPNILRVAGDISNVVKGNTFGDVARADIVKNVMKRLCDEYD
ncbi:hypothetical protein GCK32_022199, partial [Trichostrongylus colubriformis]